MKPRIGYVILNFTCETKVLYDAVGSLPSTPPEEVVLALPPFSLRITARVRKLEPKRVSIERKFVPLERAMI